MVDELQTKIAELDELLEVKEEVEKSLRIELDAEHKKLLALEAAIESLRLEMQEVQFGMREKAAEIYEELDTVEKLIRTKKLDIKQMCYGMDPESLKKGLRVAGEHIRVRVSSVSTQVTYMPGLLDEMSEYLRTSTVEGVPVAELKVNPHAIQHLILDGDLPQEVADKYKLVTKSRNPSVSFEVVEK